VDGALQAITIHADHLLPTTARFGGAIVHAKKTGRKHMEPALNETENDLFVLMNLSDEPVRLPSLPYAGTSGWSGTDTSKERAVTADKNGKTKEQQRTTEILLDFNEDYGLTWKELSLHTGWHHGTASGVLSVLHKAGKIARLTERRGRCRVYVHPHYINGRETDSQGRKPKPCPNCGHVDD
jgi:hypothetical protein